MELITFVEDFNLGIVFFDLIVIRVGALGARIEMNHRVYLLISLAKLLLVGLGICFNLMIGELSKTA